ncbi:DUF397 domain-containing protein [Streptomyces flavofungini]|uniref:DUF397 domain-containing protein n=1 Tax=Streptomyces flavofungini TaxID=68200 RepID=UPI0034DF31BE
MSLRGHRQPETPEAGETTEKGHGMGKEELYARDIGEAQWRKSSYSLLICVEVAEIGGGAMALRDSKNPGLGDLRFTPEEWAAFRDGVRAGEFD